MKQMSFGELVLVSDTGNITDIYGNAVVMCQDYGMVGFDDATQSYFAMVDFDDAEISIGHMPRIGNSQSLLSELKGVFKGDLVFDPKGIERLEGFSR
jgi:hypothetical protein